MAKNKTERRKKKVNFTNKKWCSWHLNLSGPAWSNFVYYNVLLGWVAILILPMGGHSLYVRHWTKIFFEDAHNCILFLTFLGPMQISFSNCILKIEKLSLKSYRYVCDFRNTLVWLFLSERSVTDKWEESFTFFGQKRCFEKCLSDALF